MSEPALKLVETTPVEEKVLSIKVTDLETYTAAGSLWKSIGDMIMDWQQEIEKFPMIRKAAEEALEAFEDSGVEDIYTPGLRVLDVAWCFHEDGDHEWIITIEEAAPEAYKLQGFIMEKLAEKQIAAKVITEW